MEFRRLGEKDGSLAAAVLKQFGATAGVEALPGSAHLAKVLANETCYLIAALEQDAVLGFVLAYRFPFFYAQGNAVYLYDIEVAPAQRRRGIGRRIIEQLIILLKQDAVTEIWLGTAVENSAAQRLFEATGAKKEPETFYEYIYSLDQP